MSFMTRGREQSARVPWAGSVVAVAAAVGLALASACGGDAGSAEGSAESIAPAALAARLAGSGGDGEPAGAAQAAPAAAPGEAEPGAPPLVLDVRTPGEYADGHVPGALNVPHTEIESWLAERAPAPDTEVVVYCETGVRAARAEAALREAGFERVLHLEGDMRAWRARDDLPCAAC